jgi:hypothetical protein
MGSTCLVLAPVLGRPGRAAALAASVRRGDPRCELLFLCSPDDDDEIAACRRVAWTTVVPWSPDEGGDWARKCNLGYELARQHGFEWALLGADDLAFHPGWLDAALRAHGRTRACVVGTNDLGNPRVTAGQHSTHPLVHADYIGCGGSADDPSKLLPTCYGHWFVDDEFVGQARARRTYVHAFESYVEHLHPDWEKSEQDDTYRRGQATIAEDRALFAERRRLWDPRAA